MAKPMSPKLPHGAFVYFGATLGQILKRNEDGSAQIELIAGPGHRIQAARRADKSKGIRLEAYFEASQDDIDRIYLYYKSQAEAIMAAVQATI